MRSSGRILALALALAAGLASTGEGRAEEREAAWYEQQFQRWTGVLAQLKEQDTAGSATQDIEVIRTWLGQAQAFLASERLEEIDPLLERIGAQAEFAEALIKRLQAERDLRDAEARARTAEVMAQEARKAADAAVLRQQKLEAKGL